MSLKGVLSKLVIEFIHPKGKLEMTAQGVASDSQQEQTVVAPPVESSTEPRMILPPDPLDLTVQAVREVPDLASIQNEVEIVLVCAVQYVGTAGTPPVVPDTKPEEAMEELGLARGWTRETVNAACEMVMERLAGVWQDFNTRYNVATEGDETLVDLETLSRRLATEQDEQAGLTTRAHEILAQVANVRNKLGILKQSQEAPPAVSQTQEAPQLGGFLNNLRSYGGRMVAPFYVQEAEAPDVEVKVSVAPPEPKMDAVLVG